MGSTSPHSMESEGMAPFKVPGVEKECFTWYKIHGDLKSGVTPLVIVHGGPGLSHDYLKSLSVLTTLYSIPTILYDQIGNARSTHLPETRGDENLWHERLFHAELTNLVTHLGLTNSSTGYDLLGQSWGGMLGATFAGQTPSPPGLRKLILSNSPASNALWEAAYASYRPRLPPSVLAALETGEKTQAWDSPEYEQALDVFMHRHCCTGEWPADLLESFSWASRDKTVSMTMGGPNEFQATGSLKGWTAVPVVGSIRVPTLVINGVDEGADDEAVRPFVEGIKGVKWVRFEKSTHIPLYEEREKYLRTVGQWLLEM